MHGKKDWKPLFDEDEIKLRWEEYVSELYNDDRGNPPEIDDDNDDEGTEVLMSEIEQAIKDHKKGKASGKDMTTTEMIKPLNDKAIDVIHKLVNNI